MGTSLRFWESKGWINKIDPYGWFQWYFRYWKGKKSEDDIRQMNRWKRTVNRFVGILKKLNSKNKDSKKIREILLHWCYDTGINTFLILYIIILVYIIFQFLFIRISRNSIIRH